MHRQLTRTNRFIMFVQGGEIMVVYIDVLVVLNFYIIYILLRTLCIFTHQKITTKRLLLSTGIGSLTSLAILIPNLGLWFSILIKLISCCIIILIAFDFGNIQKFVKKMLLFLFMNFIFAGIVMFVEQQFSPRKMLVSNGIFYLDISITILIISTIIAYFTIKIITILIDNKLNSTRVFNIKIISAKGEKNLPALADTGNKLRDIYSGSPVVICSFEEVRDILPNEICNFLDANDIYKVSEGSRLIPANSIGGESLIPIFKPNEIIISYENEHKSVNAIIGLTKSSSLKNDYKCIFNPVLLR